jgi:hypothetical protein
VRGAVGKLERSREGVGEVWGRGDESTRERGASGSTAARQRGRKREEKRGVSGVGPDPDRRSSPGSGPSATLMDNVRRARTCRPDRAGREAPDGWAAAQCRAAVPLTGGADLSAGTGRAWA